MPVLCPGRQGLYLRGTLVTAWYRRGGVKIADFPGRTCAWCGNRPVGAPWHWPGSGGACNCGTVIYDATSAPGEPQEAFKKAEDSLVRGGIGG